MANAFTKRRDTYMLTKIKAFHDSLTIPSASETAVLSIATVVGSAVAVLIIWLVDLALTAGVSLL